MAENSLSGNSISLTYQSVLQVNLSSNNPNPIMDGYGNASYLTIYKQTDNKPIKINSVIYPSLTANTGTFVTANNNEITEIDNNILSTSSSGPNDILYNHINMDVNISSETSAIPLIFTNNSISAFDIKNKSKFKVFDNTEERGDNNMIEFFSSGSVPTNLKILRVWVAINSHNAVRVYPSDGSGTGYVISNAGCGFVGILDGDVFNKISSISSTGECKLSFNTIPITSNIDDYSNDNARAIFYQFEYLSD